MLLLKGHLGDNQTFLYFVLVSFLGESLVACLCTISKFSVDVLKECSDWTNKYFCFVMLFCWFFSENVHNFRNIFFFFRNVTLNRAFYGNMWIFL